MLSEINYTKLPSYELGFEIGEEKGIQKGIQKGQIQGIYLLEKNPKKIAELTNIDEKTVIKIINEMNKEKN